MAEFGLYSFRIEETSMTIEDRNYHRAYSSNYYHQRKAELIARLGGKCVCCGTTENLVFDHIDPTTKSFPIGKLLNYSKAKVDEEIQKCQLLCEECHKRKTLINDDNRSQKLSSEDKQRIKELFETGKLTQQQIANLFQIHQVTVSDIVREKFPVFSLSLF